MRHDPGLAASPGVRYMLKMEGHAPSPVAVHAGQASRSRADGVAARLAGPPSKLSLPDSGVRAMPQVIGAHGRPPSAARRTQVTRPRMACSRSASDGKVGGSLI